MIINVEYLGDGVFKMWPNPTDAEVKAILAHARGEATSEQEDLESEIGGLEFRVKNLVEHIDDSVLSLEELLGEDDIQVLKKDLKARIKDLEGRP